MIETDILVFVVEYLRKPCASRAVTAESDHIWRFRKTPTRRLAKLTFMVSLYCLANA